ncbi:DNA polymerase III subunit gamma/tau [Helicobacter cetorum]|uniref:DNA polymerase III subunit gamma/tau n=1 Tax=Helicobacter cetorum (strain ATCC BAA-429 / MIT 00-7128) TaxID=182217 RepID=I0ELC7_HELC0|nr:DNA polymerase III subunit gamma/tau [Helicobacter cetorum]AFI03746.1 DNA polymerase III subunits gamma and tau [Helicobacter cetorum MIT 00-7128]
MQALALKYRPKHFSELVGQDSVAKTLSLALENNRLANAYLFSGLRGSGKTSSSRIFARALMCEEGPKAIPCDTCVHCQSALENRHIDIIEMDGASNRGIDDVRNLIEQTRYKPSLGRYKIFIIDEVHMFTTEAFNALLKTLEEPPSHVKFLLATTDALKLPATILSRTQHFRFKKIPESSVIIHLKHILELENIAYEESALERLANSGQGSLRDTLTLLEQAISYCDSDITHKKIAEMLGVIDRSVLEEFFQALLRQDNTLLEERYTLLETYETESVLEEMSLFLKNKLLENSHAYPLILMERFFKILMDSFSLLKEGANSSFVLLLLKMKMQEALKLKALEDAILELEQKNQSSLSSLQAPLNTPLSLKSNVAPTSIEPTLPPIEPQKPILNTTTPMLSAKEQIFHNLFKQLQNKIYERNYDLGVVFEKNIRFVSFEDKVLTWESLAKDEDKALLSEHFAILKKLISEVYGEGVKVALGTNKSMQKPVEENLEKPKTLEQPTPIAPIKEPNPTPVKDIKEPIIEEVKEPSETAILQEFIEDNKSLIADIKSELGAMNVELL